MDNRKKCLKKNKGGECLLYGSSAKAPAGNSASDPASDGPEKNSSDDSKGPRETFNPMKADVDLPVYYRRIRDFKDRPKYHIVEIDKNRSDYDKAIAREVSKAARLGEVKVTNTPSITTISVHTPQGTIKDLDVANRAKQDLNAVKHVGSTAFKGNVALAALDLANTLYEHREDIHTIGDVVDLAKDVVSSIPEDAVNQAKAAADAVLSGDYVTLGDIAYQFTPAPIVTRTIDNVADLVGIKGVDTTGATQHAVHTIVEHAAEAAPAPAKAGQFTPINTIANMVSEGIKRANATGAVQHAAHKAAKHATRAAKKVFKHIKFW